MTVTITGCMQHCNQLEKSSSHFTDTLQHYPQQCTLHEWQPEELGYFP